MTENIGRLVGTVALDVDPFQQSARVLATQMRSIDSALKVHETAFKNNSKNISSQKAQYELTGKQIQIYSEQLRTQTNKYDELKKSIGDVSTATAQQKTDLLSAEATMSSTAAKIDGLSASYSKLGQQIAISESNWTKSGQALQDIGEKGMKVGQGLSDFGTKMTLGVTAPIVAGVGGVVKAAMDWESAFAGTKKTVDEVVDSNGRVVYSYKDLEDGLRGLAKELPASHQEIAAVAEAAGQLGIQTPNVVSFTKTMIDLGESTNMSAETAATELARFANITQMSQDKFSNLGAALVDLGNNFATTESEISAMALRLAGAGKQIGMSEGDILGFSAALSSVGIEAEAGGSAFSKVMINMQLSVEQGMGAFDDLINLGKKTGVSFEQMVRAAQAGGKSLKSVASQMGLTTKDFKAMYKEADKSSTALENFSSVAGMTNAEFGELFKRNPAEALQKFIVGLSDTERNGKSAIAVLDDMDIKEVRLRDSLLRAANANGVFTDAIAMGNKAFKANTALTEEANKRYATTESQLKMLKNEAVDVAIEFGGPFLQAIRDSIKTVKPFVARMAELAKAFSEANPETQQAIMKFAGLIAVIGPASKILGTLTKTMFGSISTVGKLASTIGKINGTAKGASVAMSALSTGSTALTGATAAAIGGAGTGLSGMAVGMASLATPALIAAGVIAGVGVAAYAGAKAYESHQLAGAKWGTEVTKEQDKVIEKSHELREKAVSYINEYADGVKGSAEKAVQANKDIVDSIQKAIDKEYERAKKNAEKASDPEVKSQLKQQAENDKKYGEEIVQQAKMRTDKIDQILKNASQNNRDLSDAEREYIASNYKQLSNEQLNVIERNTDKRAAIESAYQADLSKMTTKQLQDRATNVDNALMSEQKKYEQNKKIILEGTKNNSVLQEKMLKDLDDSHKKSNESMILGLAKLTLAQGFSLENMSGAWEKYGWTTQEVAALVASSSEKTQKNMDMWAKSTDEVGSKWNQLALDPKTGEVRSNMADVLVDIAKTDNGWNELKLMVKHADISSNAKEEVGVALGEAGKWNNLYTSDKLLIVNGDEAKLALFDNIDKLGMWNQFNVDRKTIGIDNADAVWKMLDSEEKLTRWNSIPATDKKLLADNTDFLVKIASSQDEWNRWNELPEKQKKMLADNSDLLSKVFSSQENYNAWLALPDNLKKMLGDNTDIINKLNAGQIKLTEYDANNPALKLLLGDSVSIQIAARAGEQSLNAYNANNPMNKILNGDSTGVQNAARTGNAALNSFNSNNPAAKALNANDGVTGPVSTAARILNDFRFNIPDVITKSVVTNHSDNFIGPRQNATGNPYFEGGLTWLGDGGKAEPYLTPQGDFGISPASWTMYNLPRGTKIWSSISKMMDSFPHYANGTQFDDTVISRMNFSGNSNDSKLDRLISLLERFFSGERKLVAEGNVYLNDMQTVGKVLAPVVESVNQRNNLLNRMLKGDKFD